MLLFTWQYALWVGLSMMSARGSSKVSIWTCNGSPFTPFWVLKSVERHCTARFTFAGDSNGFQ